MIESEKEKRTLVRISDLWRWDGKISRLSYATWGTALVAVKYCMDSFVAGYFFHRSWSWLNYISPGQAVDILAMTRADQIFFCTMILLSLPFIWTGIVLTMRRLRAAGLPVWLCKLFFIPVVNLIVFASLCIFPTQKNQNVLERDDLIESNSQSLNQITDKSKGEKSPGGEESTGKGAAVGGLTTSGGKSFDLPANSEPPPVLIGGRTIYGDRHLPISKENRWSDGAYAVVMTVPVASTLAYFCTSVIPTYGWSLFIGLPFALGMASAFLYGRNHLRSLGDSVLIASIAVTLLGLGIFLWAWEGMFCLLMAAPIAYALAIMGSLLGYNLQKKKNLPVHSRGVLLSLLLILPLCTAAEYAERDQFPIVSVCTTCDIKAPPEKVWENIIAFPQLPPPTEWIFKTGIAYPVGATIKGRGVGAVRHCKFTTGNFIEPITTWDEPNLLQFSVRSQPEPMKEFSLVRDLQPAHLNGYLNVHKGEFRLSPIQSPSGRTQTRVVGTTWYVNRMWPGSYWRMYADNIMHSIHTRVLMHIKELSESQSTQGSSVP